MDYRVYFNRRGEFPWSVDKGPGTTELQTKKVTFDRVSAEAHLDPSAGDNERSPTAWFLLKNVRMGGTRDEICFMGLE